MSATFCTVRVLVSVSNFQLKMTALPLEVLISPAIVSANTVVPVHRQARKIKTKNERSFFRIFFMKCTPSVVVDLNGFTFLH